MTVFSIDKLMQETRRLATGYRQTTGQTLPVSAELAKYDAARLLKLIPLATPMKSVDYQGTEGPLCDQLVQIKSRVIFDEHKSGHRIGQLNLDGAWQVCALVLYQSDYQPTEIYIVSQTILLEAISQKANSVRVRGLMSLAQFKYLATLVWTQSNGLQWDELWSNAS